MTKSIFIPHNFEPSYFSSAGISINLDPEAYSNFIYTANDSLEMFNAIKKFANKHGIVAPTYDLCDKQKAHDKFKNVGFNTLDTALVKTQTDLENFPHTKVILKPNVSCNTNSDMFKLGHFMYCVRDKKELLEQLQASGSFNEGVIQEEPFIVQQAAEGNEDNYAALIMSGVVNGAGTVWHFPPLELKTHFKDKVRKVKSVWSEDNNTDEVFNIQTRINALLSAESSKNCFYQLQFLRTDVGWAPHDFQYRLTYYVHEYVGSPRFNFPFIDFKTAIIKYAYDESMEKPNLPTNFGLSFQSNTKPHERKFITGASKDEVLRKLELI